MTNPQGVIKDRRNGSNGVVEAIEAFSSCLNTQIVYYIMFLVNPGHSMKEVRDRRMNYSEPMHDFGQNVGAFVEDADAISLILDEAKRNLDGEERRAQTSDERGKVFLMIATILVAACSALAARTTIGLALIPFVPAVLSVYVLVANYRPVRVVVPKFEEMKSATSHESLKRILIAQYLHRANYADPQNAYRIGVVQTAARLLLLATAALLVVVIVSAFCLEESRPTDVNVQRVNTQTVNPIDTSEHSPRIRATDSIIPDEKVMTQKPVSNGNSKPTILPAQRDTLIRRRQSK